jgi:DNA gyrase subunit B
VKWCSKNRNGWRWIARKLSDCSEQDPAKCEVYLVEEIRQEERQNKVVSVSSNLPLRGKILNVEKAMHHKV